MVRCWEEFDKATRAIRNKTGPLSSAEQPCLGALQCERSSFTRLLEQMGDMHSKIYAPRIGTKEQEQKRNEFLNACKAFRFAAPPPSSLRLWLGAALFAIGCILVSVGLFLRFRKLPDSRRPRPYDPAVVWSLVGSGGVLSLFGLGVGLTGRR